MSSSIFGPSKPKSVALCRNCSEPILFSQERVCNIGEKISYSVDSKLHRCPDNPAYKESECYCEHSTQQLRKKEPNSVQISESVPLTIEAVEQLKAGEKGVREGNIHSISRAVSFYRCMGCNREIYLDKRTVDDKGRVVALNEEGRQLHVCPPSNNVSQLSSALKERTCDNQDTQETKGSGGMWSNEYS